MPVASLTGGSARTRRRRAVRLALLAIAGASLATARPVAATASGLAATAQAPGEPVDCLDAVHAAAPGTPKWDELNAANAYCARERDQDKPAHRVLDRTAPADAYREPSRHDGVRFRYDTTTIGTGARLEASRQPASNVRAMCASVPSGAWAMGG
jgi:hypothetical protein